ncbi:MAG: elongation factor P-like protein YeiP [Pseudomonadota bacterium]
MPKACDLKRGAIVEIDGKIYLVKHVDVKTPSSRGAVTLYKVRYSSVPEKQKHEVTYRGDDSVNDVNFVRKPVQYSYHDGDMYTFMDTEDYSQHTLSADDLEGQLEYLTDGLEGILALLVDDNIIGIELPQSVELEVIETAPAMKGSSATARTKAAKLSTGLEIQVPEYLETGEIVKVSTVTGKYVSRA